MVATLALTSTSFADETEPPIPSWRLSVDLPFSQTDLARAVAARVPGQPSHLDCSIVEVQWTKMKTGLVAVVCDQRDRVVRINDRRGADAARLIAIVLVELAADELEPLAIPIRAALERSSTMQVGTTEATLTSQSSLSAQREKPSIVVRGGLGGLVSRGVQSTDVLLPGLNVSLELGRGARWLGAEVRYQSSRPRNDGLSPKLGRTSARLRVGIDRGIFRASANVASQRLTVTRTAAYSRTSFSAGLSTALRFALGSELWFVCELGVDGHARRVVLDFEDSPLATSPRIGISLATSLQWAFGAR